LPLLILFFLSVLIFILLPLIFQIVCPHGNEKAQGGIKKSLTFLMQAT